MIPLRITMDLIVSLITKGSFSSLSSITALAVFFSRGGRALSAAKVCVLVMIVYFGGPPPCMLF